MIIRKEPARTYVQFGDSLPDVESYIASEPVKWSVKDSERGPSSESWDLNTGWQKTLELARTGWTAGAVDLHAMVEALPPHSRTASVSYDVAGDYPDVGRYVSGEPLHMRTAKHKLAKAPVIHLLVNVVCSGWTKASSMASYGAAIAALVDQLENKGRRVELDVVAVNVGLPGCKRSLVGWKVKRAADPMDLSAVAFSIGHPAAFRRIMFAIWERTERAHETYGYGRCGTLTEQDALSLDAEGALLIDGIREAGQQMNPMEALRYAAAQLNKAAGETLVELEP